MITDPVCCWGELDARLLRGSSYCGRRLLHSCARRTYPPDRFDMGDGGLRVSFTLPCNSAGSVVQ